MNPAALAFYGKEADRHAQWLNHQPVILGGEGARLRSLAFVQRFNRDAHYADIRDSSGVLRWVSQKQMRVYGIIARISLSPDGRAKMIDIALEAQCCTSTVSRTILKLQAWGLYAVDVRRGRNGGITVRRPFGQWAKAYIAAARQKLADMAFRARIKLASTLQRREEGSVGVPTTYLPSMDASFTPTTFHDRVLYARAYLALEDPEGEYEAVRPLDHESAVDRLLSREDRQRRHEERIRQAAFRGDWDEWERLRRETVK